MNPTLTELCIKTIITRYAFFRPADFASLPTEMCNAVFDEKQKQDHEREASQMKQQQMIRINGMVYFNEEPITRTDWASYRL